MCTETIIRWIMPHIYKSNIQVQWVGVRAYTNTLMEHIFIILWILEKIIIEQIMICSFMIAIDDNMTWGRASVSGSVVELSGTYFRNHVVIAYDLLHCLFLHHHIFIWIRWRRWRRWIRTSNLGIGRTPDIEIHHNDITKFYFYKWEERSLWF